MYALLFRLLPGPLWVRIILSVILLFAVLFLLVTVVFPWISEITNLTEATVGHKTFTP